MNLIRMMTTNDFAPRLFAVLQQIVGEQSSFADQSAAAAHLREINALVIQVDSLAVIQIIVC